MRGFKNLVSIAVTTDYTFKEAEQMKEMILHPENFAAAAAAAAPAAAAPAEEKKEEKVEEKVEEEEEDMDMGGLFD